MFEYVATDIYASNPTQAIERAKGRVHGLTVVSVKRVSDKGQRAGHTTYTVVLVVRG